MVMRTLRNKVSLILWLSAVLLVALVVGLIAPNFMGGGGNTAGAAAVVDGQAVDSQKFSDLLDARLEQFRRQEGADPSDAQSNAIRRDVLNGLIDEQLALEHAADLGQTMSPAEFRQVLLNDPDLQDGHGQFDQARYDRILESQAEQGIPWQQAEKNFQRSMLLNKIQAFWDAQAVLTPAEQAAAVARYNRQVQARALVWNLDALSSRQHPGEEDIHDYYSEHKQEWRVPEQVRLRQIVVPTGFAANTATARAKAEGILARLKKGASFAALAAQNNPDQASRKAAGELGWVSRDDLRDPALVQAAFGLKPGAVSGVLATRDGYTLVKVEGKKPGHEPTFANSRDKAARALSLERAQAQAQVLASQAIAGLKQGLSLETEAKATDAEVRSTGWFGRDDAQALPSLGPDPAFAQAIFDLDKGGILPSPVAGPKAVAVAVLTAERPGPPPAKQDAQAQRDAEALRDARSARARALFRAWIASLRAKAKITDQSGALASR